MTAGVRCTVMRGGTSKGAYFVADDLPADEAERDDLLLRMMGSPDPRQIDGIGGAHPLTSKVAVVSRAVDDDADLDYLFLQLGVGEATVGTRQNCGNLLAGVGQFGVERALIAAGDETTTTRIRMLNSGAIATCRFPTPGGVVEYAGDTAVPGVPGTAAPVLIGFADTEGSTCGALLPTGQLVDEIDGVRATCIDNGMPVVVVAAADLGVTGYETPDQLTADEALTARIQSIRLAAGKLMGLGDTSGDSVPKTALVAAPVRGGLISTRTFIPVAAHSSIGTLAAITIATAVLVEGAVGHELASIPAASSPLGIEHPTGIFRVTVELDPTAPRPRVLGAGVVRTARKLMDGYVYPRPAGARTAGDERER